jgi:hypothetical protein
LLLLLLLPVERVVLPDDELDIEERLLLLFVELVLTFVADELELLLTIPLFRDTDVFALLLLRVTVVGVLLLRDPDVETLLSDRTERVVDELPLKALASRPELSTPTEERVERFVFVLFTAALDDELRPDTELSLKEVLRPVVPEPVLRLEVADELLDEDATDELRPLTPPAEEA